MSSGSQIPIAQRTIFNYMLWLNTVYVCPFVQDPRPLFCVNHFSVPKRRPQCIIDKYQKVLLCFEITKVVLSCAPCLFGVYFAPRWCVLTPHFAVIRSLRCGLLKQLQVSRHLIDGTLWRRTDAQHRQTARVNLRPPGVLNHLGRDAQALCFAHQHL